MNTAGSHADRPHSVQFSAALSRNPQSSSAVEEVVSQALEPLDGPPDLALLFLSAPHLGDAEPILEAVAAELATPCLIGCSGESLVGVATEVEWEPCLSLWLGRLPRTTLLPLRLEFQRTPDGGSIVGWPDQLLEPWPDDCALLLLADPFSFPADLLLEQLNESHPGVPVIGGMASAAQQPGGNCLFLNRECHRRGAVGVWLHGGVHLQTVVSQGCRPVGQHFVITKAERNVIQQLGGLPAYQRLEEVYHTLATSEQRMMQQGLHLGRVVNEYQDRFAQGDFLVRNVVGVDPAEGGIAIGEYVRVGQTVQFHIRDASTADGELQQLLGQARSAAQRPPEAALLFTCNGRGTRLFSQPHHDARAIQAALGSIPLAGFFAAGELGPIGGQNFVHGFTASLALFSPE